MKLEAIDEVGIGASNATLNSLQDRVSGGVRYQAGIDQPYIEDRNGHPLRGRQCVRLRTGMAYNNETGLYVPKYTEYTTAQLRRRGINGAAWNATSLPRQIWTHFIRDAVEVAR